MEKKKVYINAEAHVKLYDENLVVCIAKGSCYDNGNALLLWCYTAY